MPNHTTGASAPDLDTIRLYLEGHHRLAVQALNRLVSLATVAQHCAGDDSLAAQLVEIIHDEASAAAEAISEDWADIIARCNWEVGQ